MNTTELWLIFAEIYANIFLFSIHFILFYPVFSHRWFNHQLYSTIMCPSYLSYFHGHEILGATFFLSISFFSRIIRKFVNVAIEKIQITADVGPKISVPLKYFFCQTLIFNKQYYQKCWAQTLLFVLHKLWIKAYPSSHISVRISGPSMIHPLIFSWETWRNYVARYYLYEWPYYLEINVMHYTWSRIGQGE